MADIYQLKINIADNNQLNVKYGRHESADR